MIKGMTGFGSSPFVVGKIRGLIEVKSLNHRYLDVGCYLPLGFGSVEDKIRQITHRHLERGKITVSVKVTEKPTQQIYLNKEAVKDYLKYAQFLKKEFGIGGQLSLSEMIRLPGVVDAREITLDVETLWPAIENSTEKALLELRKMREREGKSLAKDIQGQLSRMLLQIKAIKSRAKAILKEYKKKLSNEEFMSFQKSNDINEELSRLTHYIEEFKALLKTTLAVGKKLDFVAQEMQREINTVGSKLQDKIVSNAVIALKSKVEKIREQSQNIE